MDIKNTILGIIIILLIGLPIAAYTFYNFKRKRDFFKNVNSIAQKHNISMVEYDIWSNSVIALDRYNRKIFFYNKNMNIEQPIIVAIIDIKTCRSNINSRQINGNRVIDKLDLIFSFKDKTVTDLKINFFNSHEIPQITDELQLVEKWERIINLNL